MAEQPRGFSSFMRDPKTSLMGYIADNIPADRLHHQQQGAGNAGNPQANPIIGQQPNSQNPNQFQQTNQSQSSLMRPQDQIQANNPQMQAPSPQPMYSQPGQTSQSSLLSQPYIASNLNGAPSSRPNSPPTQSTSQSIFSHLPGHHMGSMLDQTHLSSHLPHVQSQNSIGQIGNAITGVLQGPPPAGTRRAKPAQSASRLYHRMLQDFESTKSLFNVAKSEHNVQTMTSSAYELESLSRRIWSLRVEHAWEFEGYSDAEHQVVVSGWRSQYELWADTILDIQEAQIGQNNAQVHGGNSVNGSVSPWGSQSGQDKPGTQELNGAGLQGQFNPHEAHMPPLHNLSLDQNMPPNQYMSSQQQGMPIPQNSQSMVPGTFPQSDQPVPVSSPGYQSAQPQPMQIPPPQQMPMGQAGPPMQSPPPQQMSMGQTGPQGQNQPPHQMPMGQGGPPMQPTPPPGQRPQNMPPTAGPNMQQQGQNMAAGSGLSPQQNQNKPPGPGPQMQAPGQNTPSAPGGYMPQAANMQAGPGANTPQRPNNMPSGPPGSYPNSNQGPPRNPMPPGQGMQQGQNQAGRPGMPASLQAGGPMQGGGRS